MVGGFNHNFSYKGHTYHVQTEDSGVPRARITTLLYRAGSIIARETTDYSAIRADEDISPRVEQMMKDQHRNMLKNLKEGVFDAKIARFDVSSAGAANIGVVSSESAEDIAVAEAKDLAAAEKKSAKPDPSVPDSKSTVQVGHLDARVKEYLDAGR